MSVGAGLYMYDAVVKKFPFVISSPREFLATFGNGGVLLVYQLDGLRGLLQGRRLLPAQDTVQEPGRSSLN